MSDQHVHLLDGRHRAKGAVRVFTGSRFSVLEVLARVGRHVCDRLTGSVELQSSGLTPRGFIVDAFAEEQTNVSDEEVSAMLDGLDADEAFTYWVGRVARQAAAVESALHAVSQAVQPDKDLHPLPTHEPIGTFLTGLRARVSAQTMLQAEDRTHADTIFGEVKAALYRRNSIVHDFWVLQADVERAVIRPKGLDWQPALEPIAIEDVQTVWSELQRLTQQLDAMDFLFSDIVQGAWLPLRGHYRAIFEGRFVATSEGPQLTDPEDDTGWVNEVLRDLIIPPPDQGKPAAYEETDPPAS